MTVGHPILVGIVAVGLALAVRTEPGGNHFAQRQDGPSAVHLTATPQDASNTQAPGVAPDSAAVDRGRVTYGFYCMSCHGGDGRGGVDGGGDLTESEMFTAADGARQFAEFLPRGRPEQRMPPTPLPESDIADLWAFLQIMLSSHAAAGAAAGGAPFAGDGDAGETLFRTAGCSKCHSATGDLKGIGARLDVATIHARLLLSEPGRQDAGPPARGTPAGSLRRHTESVKKLSEQAVRDLAVYLATLR